MKIHLSEATNRELQSSEFVTEYRGRVPVKVSLKCLAIHFIYSNAVSYFVKEES